jgi:hypothetical protein
LRKTSWRFASRRIRDHSLTATDVAQFAGSFTAALPSVVRRSCWAQERGFAGADISNDLVLVTPGSAWPRDQLAFTVQNSPHRDGFIISGCSRSSISNSAATTVVFDCMVFRLA